MLAVSQLAMGFSAPGLVPAQTARASAVTMETKADLVALAEELNPVVGYWDPLKLADYDFWGQGNEATIGWLRESEIKHGRIAMAGFVGYIVHSLGLRIQGDQIANSIPKMPAPDTWDALPDVAKWQIIVFVGILDTWRENKVVLANEGEKHYMKGGKPGYFPTFDLLPHTVPYNLYDPWGVMKNKSEAEKANGRLVEINNGRLAMLGLFGFLSEARVPGSVPFLKGVIPFYNGEPMAPFTENQFAMHGAGWWS